MKKVIRSKVTRAFLSPDGSWTSDLEQAWGFDHTSDALAVKRDMGLQEVELYFAFPEAPDHGKWDFTVSLGE